MTKGKYSSIAVISVPSASRNSPDTASNRWETILATQLTIPSNIQKESADSCTVYASDTLGLIQNDPRYAKVIQSDSDLKNIPQKHLEHKLLTASATVSGKKVNMAEDNGSANAEAPLTVVNTRGFDLPKTGDNGTMMFTIVGILLMVGAAAVLYAVSSKKSA